MNNTKIIEVSLGCKARDTITGFEGIVVAITDWLNGCKRITIQPQKMKEDGSPIGNHTFDVEQVEVVADPEPRHEPKRTGGPSITPTRNTDPQ